MGPVVSQLEARYAGRVVFRHHVLDRLVPGTPEHSEAYRLATAAGVTRTPTYLVAGRDGHVRARFTGVTGWLSLTGALDAALGAP